MNLDELNDNEDEIDEEEQRIFEAYRYSSQSVQLPLCSKHSRMIIFFRINLF